MNETRYFSEAELKRQLDFLHSKATAEWKARFPERWEEDVKRLETALGAFKKVEEKPVEPTEESKEKKKSSK